MGPSRRDLLRLRTHHSFQKERRSHMGGKKWESRREWEDWRDWSSSDPRSWQLWPGAYHVSPKATAKAAALPARYDQIAVPESKQAVAATEQLSVLGTGQGELHRAVQKALTAAKKADIKLRKLQEERVRREAQWAAYSKSTKAKFLAQRQQFLKDLERIQSEMDAVTESGQEASANVKHLVDNGLPAAATQMDEESHWETLLAQEEEQQPAGFLQEAMRAVGANNPRGQEAAPSTGIVPPEVAARLLAATLGIPLEAALQSLVSGQPIGGPTGNPPQPVARAPGPPGIDQSAVPPPYVMSPSHPKVETQARQTTSTGGGGPSTSAQAALSAATRTSPMARKERVPVKGQTIQPVHTVQPRQLGDKLENKLEARRRVMTPFGGGSTIDQAVTAVLGPPGPQTAPEGHTAPIEAATAIHDPDSEVEMEEPGGKNQGPALDGMG